MNKCTDIKTLTKRQCNSNDNDLFANDFLLAIPSMDITQKIQSVLLPEVMSETTNLGEFELNAKLMPDRIVFSRLVVDFKVNQDLYNYKVIYDWMACVNKYCPSDPLYESYMRDIYLMVINPITFKPDIAYFHMKNCFPVVISSPSFDPISSSVMRVNVSFEIEDLEIIIL